MAGAYTEHATEEDGDDDVKSRRLFACLFGVGLIFWQTAAAR